MHASERTLALQRLSRAVASPSATDAVLCAQQTKALLDLPMPLEETRETAAALRPMFRRVSGQHYAHCPHAGAMRLVLKDCLWKLIKRANPTEE